MSVGIVELLILLALGGAVSPDLTRSQPLLWMGSHLVRSGSPAMAVWAVSAPIDRTLGGPAAIAVPPPANR